MKLIQGIEHIFTPKYKPLGFFKYKNTFARIRGDTLQTFTLTKRYYVPEYTVEFEISPLCLPQPFFLEGGIYRLDQFFVELQGSGWKFDQGSYESKKNSLEMISQAIDSHLLPLFNRCFDCRSSLSELRKLDELFEDNRKKVLCLWKELDRAKPFEERVFWDYRKYYMALKAEDWEYAHRYLSYQIRYYESELKTLNMPGTQKQPECVKEGFEKTLVLRKEHLERLETRDHSFFNDLMYSNEEQMLEFLSVRYPRLLRDK